MNKPTSVFALLILLLVFATALVFPAVSGGQEKQRTECEKACRKAHNACRQVQGANIAECKKAYDGCLVSCKETPSPEPTVSPSPEVVPSPVPTVSPTPEPNPTVSPTPIPSPTVNPSPAPSPMESPSPVPSPMESPSPVPSPTVSPSPEMTPSPSPSV